MRLHAEVNRFVEWDPNGRWDPLRFEILRVRQDGDADVEGPAAALKATTRSRSGGTRRAIIAIAALLPNLFVTKVEK